MMSNHTDLLRQLGWQSNLILAACSNCGLSLMQPPEMFGQPCVHCGSYLIEELDPNEDRPPHLAPPELILDAKLGRDKTEKVLSNWLRRFYFPPADLKLATLMERLRLMYVPLWLMDTTLDTQWAADVGFDYEVVSSQERYRGSSWTTTEVKRVQQDWEGRAGTIDLRYDNLPADAVEQEFNFWPLIRLHPSQNRMLDLAKVYEPAENMTATFILPSRVPNDAVTDMLPSLMGRAQADVQEACRADHIRNFNWAPRIEDQNWTKLLIPVWSSWYKDEDERTRMVFLHGGNGAGWGEKIPSMRRAWRVGLYFSLVAILLLAIGLTFGLAADNWAIMGLATVLIFFIMGTFLILALYVVFQKNKDFHFSKFS